MNEKIQRLKQLCAAYEAAKHCDYCPKPNEAESLPEELHTKFTSEEFLLGAMEMQGYSADDVVSEIISLVASL